MNKLMRSENKTDPNYYQTYLNHTNEYARTNVKTASPCNRCNCEVKPFKVNGVSIPYLGIIHEIHTERRENGTIVTIRVEGKACSLSCAKALGKIYDNSNGKSIALGAEENVDILADMLGVKDVNESPYPYLAEWNNGALTREKYISGRVFRKSYVTQIVPDNTGTYYMSQL